MRQSLRRCRDLVLSALFQLASIISAAISSNIPAQIAIKKAFCIEKSRWSAWWMGSYVEQSIRYCAE